MNGAALDDTVRRAVFAAAGELQVAAAETSLVQIAEADLRSALRRGLQMQLGRCVETERRHCAGNGAIRIRDRSRNPR